MKALWVCNTMLPVVAKQLNKVSSVKEGWLSGLMDSFLTREESRDIELSVAFPVSAGEDGLFVTVTKGDRTLDAYGFYEDTDNPHIYDEGLEERLSKILQAAKPDVIHCFGTEFPHSLALVRICRDPERLIVGIQGVCQVIEKAYMADLPSEVYEKDSFRDWLKKDGCVRQKEKFALRAAHETEILTKVKNVAGRTAFDRFYAKKCNPNVNYYILNETVRPTFYEGGWDRTQAGAHEIFISQGDYPLKGFHYMLIAMGTLKAKYSDVTLKVAGNSLVNYGTLKEKIKISGYGKYLRTLIAHYGLEDRVHILGKLDADQMKQQYLRSSVFVCCSANENSPNSLGEAMLLGVPCVAADVGGIRDLFTEEDGVLFPGSNFYLEEGDFRYEGDNPRDMMQIADNLAKAIETVWEQTDSTEQKRLHARTHALATHDKENNFLRTMDIYRELSHNAWD